MRTNRRERWLLVELEAAGMRHRNALLSLRNVITFADHSGAVHAGVFETALRNIQNAREVYDMVVLQLVDCLHSAGRGLMWNEEMGPAPFLGNASMGTDAEPFMDWRSVGGKPSSSACIRRLPYAQLHP
jgi:hypothetical protein